MDTLNMALIQAVLAWENPEDNRSYFEGIFKGLNPGTHLVVLPEMFTTGFTMEPEPVAESMEGITVQWMKQWAAELGMALAGSIVIKDAGQYRNRFLFVRPDGTLEYYDKRHGFTYAGEHKKYINGTQRKVIGFRGWKIFPQVCYDLRFPVFSRNDLDYDLLIYTANWPEKRINACDALLKARAIENMAFCAGVNRLGKDGNDYQYPGHSAVYDPLGECLAYTETEGVVTASLSRSDMMKNREKLGFLNDRDQFTLNPE